MIRIEHVSESEYVYQTRALGLSPILVEDCSWLTFLGKQVPLEPNLGLATWDLGFTLPLGPLRGSAFPPPPFCSRISPSLLPSVSLLADKGKKTEGGVRKTCLLGISSMPGTMPCTI